MTSDSCCFWILGWVRAGWLALLSQLFGLFSNFWPGGAHESFGLTLDWRRLSCYFELFLALYQLEMTLYQIQPDLITQSLNTTTRFRTLRLIIPFLPFHCVSCNFLPNLNYLSLSHSIFSLVSSLNPSISAFYSIFPSLPSF